MTRFIPIATVALLALGAFTFFAGFAVYLLLSGARAPRSAVVFFAAISTTPLLVSLMMLTISLTQLGTVCQTCVGIYGASFLLFLPVVSTCWSRLPSR